MQALWGEHNESAGACHKKYNVCWIYRVKTDPLPFVLLAMHIKEITVNLRVKTGVTSNVNLAHFKQIGGWEYTGD